VFFNTEYSGGFRGATHTPPPHPPTLSLKIYHQMIVKLKIWYQKYLFFGGGVLGVVVFWGWPPPFPERPLFKIFWILHWNIYVNSCICLEHWESAFYTYNIRKEFTRDCVTLRLYHHHHPGPENNIRRPRL
jgi:hypothetical protein